MTPPERSAAMRSRRNDLSSRKSAVKISPMRRSEWVMKRAQCWIGSAKRSIAPMKASNDATRLMSSAGRGSPSKANEPRRNRLQSADRYAEGASRWMTENRPMQFPKRDRDFKWNLNTIIQLVTLAVMLIGGVTVWVNTQRDVNDLISWRNGHESYHKERLRELKVGDARTEERFRGIEADVRKLTSQSENMTYRLTVVEQSSANVAQSIKELQAQMSQSSGDIKVIKEILQRIEAAQRGG